MARGDVKSSSTGTSRGGWGSGSSYSYDDEGRGQSLEVWEFFKRHVEDQEQAGLDWMFGLDKRTAHRLITASTYRYGLNDITRRYDEERYGTPAYEERVNEEDSRAKRLVEKQYKKNEPGVWLRFHRFLMKSYAEWEAEQEREQKERQERREAQWKKEQEEREAEKVRIELADQLEVSKQIENAVGAIHADFVDAFEMQEVTGQVEGDYLDDAVDGLRAGHGFGIEQRKPGGIKLQVTLSLDLSNSMYYNNIHIAAAMAFREIGQAIREIRAEFPDDLFFGAFTFSEDGWSDSERGKRASWLGSADNDTVAGFGEFESFSPSKVRGWYGRGPFTGEDTWITPLFTAIHNWETNWSDQGAARLDLVLTDAVLEHAKDIREASDLQDERDGNLQTVLLNFMPETDWLGSTLPHHCVQYAVSKENVSGMLRHILAEFIGSQL